MIKDSRVRIPPIFFVVFHKILSRAPQGFIVFSSVIVVVKNIGIELYPSQQIFFHLVTPAQSREEIQR